MCEVVRLCVLPGTVIQIQVIDLDAKYVLTAKGRRVAEAIARRHAVEYYPLPRGKRNRTERRSHG